MNGDGNGNRTFVRLSWGQLVWGISALFALTAGWYDLRSRQIILQERIEAFMREADKEHSALYGRIRDIESERRISRGGG